jgi:hypothetical protein
MNLQSMRIPLGTEVPGTLLRYYVDEIDGMHVINRSVVHHDRGIR